MDARKVKEIYLETLHSNPHILKNKELHIVNLWKTSIFTPEMLKTLNKAATCL
jgi:hypothetical protein